MSSQKSFAGPARDGEPPPTDVHNPLSLLLAERIRANGPIPFSEFMRQALYHADYGYYSRSTPQTFQDYYTSVDVHPVFGRLLGRQIAEMWSLLGTPTPFYVVECGAGTGALAANLLDFSARELPEFYRALHYVAVERSAGRRAMHPTRLAQHISVGRAASAATIPETISAGCILSNELLDALPTHRLLACDGQLQELLVDFQADRFVDVVGPLSTPLLARYFQEQGITLPDGNQAEACLEACDWIEAAGKALQRGFVLTIDYGHEAPALYNDRHNRGTLIAYYQHAASEDVLRNPGGQDLTAHVNFTALQLWGRHAGLEPTGLTTQSQFLVALGRANEFADLYDPGQNEVDKLRARLLLKNLIHPEGLGEKFQVLIQHKGIARPRLTGLSSY